MREPGTLKDKAVGLAKRALGEITGRPDIVIEGERQEAAADAEDAERQRREARLAEARDHAERLARDRGDQPG